MPARSFHPTANTKRHNRFILISLSILILAAGILWGAFILVGDTEAANPQGDLQIEVFTAYNLIVDSNVETPATYAPEAFHIGAQFCNTGGNNMTGVVANVGDFSGGTPGLYPSRQSGSATFDNDHPHLAGTPGTYQLTHLGGSAGAADGRRFIGTLPAGECRTQYWLVTYPRRANLAAAGDNGGVSVTGGIKPDDDLWLTYDIWATADDDGTSLTADVKRTVTMRNEISAMANKIWPNTNSKVPNEFLQVVNELGWSNPNVATDGATYPGQTFTMEGIWYDLGNVRFGFDNNGDLLPDYNAWLQPIGDGGNYDPGCFRLVRTDAIVVVKLNDGSFDVRTAVDQLYFENLPPNNNGAVGLVYYTFAALDGSCRGTLTPYQEVASGYDNEKFNADYGASIPPLLTRDPEVSFDKAVDLTLIPAAPGLPATLAYTLTFTNTGPVAIGNPDLGVPLVVRDGIPAGTTYVGGSAAAGNSLPTGVTAYQILYSTDNGTSWSSAEPNPATAVTDIQWWLNEPLDPAAGGAVTFDITVPSSFPDPFVPNTGALSFGSAAPFLEDDTLTLVPGPNSIGDTVWADNGDGGGFLANGILDGSEAGIPNVTVSLYFDANGDGQLDGGDTLLANQATNGSGNYLFANLPNGDYLAVVDDFDSDIPTGYINTTPIVSASTGLSGGTADLDNDFGFAPALTGNKKLQGSSPIYEGRLVDYTLTVRNNLPGNGSGQPASCVYTFWAQAEDPNHTGSGNQMWTNSANAFGASALDNVFAFSDYSKGSNNIIAGRTFNAVSDGGTITKVEAVFPAYVSQPLINDTAIASLYYNNTGNTPNSTQTFTTATLNQYVGLNSASLIPWDITSFRAWTWSDLNTGLVNIGLEAQKQTDADVGVLYLDAIGLRITTDQTCGSPEQTIDPVPVTDTYDPAKLEFVSAVPAVSSMTPGTLTWDNVGPLHAGSSETLVVTFKALEPAGNLATTVTNTMEITAATFVNGKPANDVLSSVPITLEPTGTISGVVWSDLNGSGWASGTTGQQAGEPGIPGVTVTLYSCTQPFANNNTCGGTEETFTTVTDANGQYLFEGLVFDRYYRAAVTPPAGSQTGDPEDDNNSSPGNTGNYGTCGSGGSNAACDNAWLSSGDGSNGFQLGTEIWGGNSQDVTNINFGYTGVPALIFGNVWYDVNGDASQAPTDNPLAPVTVYLCTASPCTSGNAVQTTTTDANGDYNFEVNPGTPTTYYIGVNTASGPLGAGWSQTVDPGEAGVCTTCDSQHTVPNVQGGRFYGSYDFAYTKSGTAQIGDTIYYDWNGDGTQDPEDEGIPNRSVTLYEDFDGDGAITPGVDPVIATTVTSADGSYLFNNLPAGDYLVFASAPPGTIPTGDPDQAGVRCAVCDNWGSSPNLASSGSDLTEDFGYQPYGAGQIGDTVWFDADGDQIQAGVLETGIPNVTVSLEVDLNGDGSYVTLTSTVTGPNGSYLFDNLPAGSYRVVVDDSDADLPQDAFGNASVPSTPTSADVLLSSGQSYLDADFGFVNLGAIGDTIYWDANDNGTQDWSESGVAGVTVYLCTSSPCGSGNAVQTAVTDANGNYLFDALPPDDYTVAVDTSGPLSGTAQTADPDRDGENCTSTTYPALSACDNETTEPISYGTNYMGADFGYLPTGIVGDYVWFDQDGDGVQDGSELGIPGVVVTITNGITTYTTTTDPDGGYTFVNLADGSWTVTFEPPPNMTPTSGPQSVGSTSTTVVISSGGSTSIGGSSCTDCDLDVDLGLTYSGPYSLTGSICLEVSGQTDGGCDGGSDSPVGSQTVYLYNGAGRYLGSTTADASGAYTFTNLIADSYSVVLGMATAQLTDTALTTTIGTTPANQSPNAAGSVAAISENAASVVQTVVVDGTTAAGDGSVDDVDFPFVPELIYDFGDLPDSYSTTLTGSPSGPRHALGASLYLGSAPDGETNGAPGTQADGDGSDEDGVTLNGTWSDGPGGGSFSVDVTGSGWLVGWMDFNGDGDFYDSGEMIVSQAVSTGTIPLSVDVPNNTFGAGNVTFYTRFRLFPNQPSFPEIAFTGAAGAGEVEDYVFNFTPSAVTLGHGEALAAGSKPPVWLLLGILALAAVTALLGLRRRLGER